MLDITVVVPTYNRRNLLEDAVASLRKQTHPPDRYEILIVSDGCTDGTDALYKEPKTSPLTRLVRQEKQGFGLAAARNLGIQEARGQLVMFFDDDMIADEAMVQAHVEAHREMGEMVAVRGRVKPAPQLPDTPFCKIVLGDVCRLYEVDTETPRFLGFGNALSWQTSFRRNEIAQLGGYEESFRSYGWEDIEFSYRVSRAGLRFYYEPKAISFHNDQRQTLTAHGKRLENSARMAPVLFARHPEIAAQIPMYLDKGPIVWHRDGPQLIAKKLARGIVASSLGLGTLQSLTPIIEKVTPWPGVLRRWYYGILGGYIVRGYREGLLAANGRQGGD